MDKILSIIVPYRNREEHLAVFINNVPNFLLTQNIQYSITIVEQADDKPFNRAKLLNVGFAYNQNVSDYFCFHDIDMIPTEADYSYPDKPYHLASNIEQFAWNIPYVTYYGGVNIINKSDFLTLNGYSNEFWGWGGEDDDFVLRLKQFGWDIYRKKGIFNSLFHTPNGPNHNHYSKNFEKLNQKYDYKLDGISNLAFELLEKHNINSHVNLIKVIV